jgi:hypothetical protein
VRHLNLQVKKEPYEKRHRDKESTPALKGNKQKVKNLLIQKERHKLTKLKASI